MSIRLAATAIVAILILAACNRLMPGGSPGATDSGAPDLDGSWRLTSGTHGSDTIDVPEGSEITMDIDGDEIGGRAACNLYSGTLMQDGDSVEIGPLAVTEMGCPGPIMDAESAFIAALTAVTTASRSDDTLTLSGTDVELTFELVPPVADAELVGTAWVLESVITGDAVASTVGDPATLEFADDGTFSGFTGCRTFQGAYTLDGGTVRVSELVQDDRGCPEELVPQDEHVLSVLADGFDVSIDGERLSLTDGDLGLDYRVADG